MANQPAGHVDRPASDEYAAPYLRYVERVPEGDLVSILRAQIGRTVGRLAPLPAERAGYAYAPGKWTIREVVGHIADTERVLAYRTLRIARGDPAPLSGFEENAYVTAAGFDQRTLTDLLGELRMVRMASIVLFDGLKTDAWLQRGIVSGHSISVRALACIIAGHELHHRAVLQDRYGVGAAPDELTD